MFKQGALFILSTLKVVRSLYGKQFYHLFTNSDPVSFGEIEDVVLRICIDDVGIIAVQLAVEGILQCLECPVTQVHTKGCLFR